MAIFTIKMKKTQLLLICFITSITLLSSCKVYKQNILFKTEESTWVDSVQTAGATALNNYTIKVNDQIDLKVYANNGELIIDPNFELRKELGGVNGRISSSTTQIIYEVKNDSTINLPMIGNTKVVNYTIQQLDSLLQIKYSKHYEDPFVKSTVLNRRVIILGSEGGQVIPLTSMNINLIEILAMYGGISNNGRGHNIRLIRGDLKNPQVQLIDLTTIEGLKKANLQIKSNDIIYIEPIRKPIIESIRDIAPIIGLFTSIITLAFLFSRN